MRIPLVVIYLVAVVAMPGIASAQETPEPAAKTAVQKEAAPHVALSNVQIELSIADTLSTTPPQRKTVSMLVAEGYMGRVRSQRGGAAVLNVDATPRLQKDGRISLQLVLEYRPPESADRNMLSPINEMLTVLLQSGKTLIVTQAADPSVDRKVAVEVTATVLK